MITLTNDFHGTSARLHAGTLSKRTIKRVRAELCGAADCTCGGSLGERGPQAATIIEGPNDTVIVQGPILVTVWRGTEQHQLYADDYNDAMRIVDRLHRNAFPPSYEDSNTGRALIDAGGYFVDAQE